MGQVTTWKVVKFDRFVEIEKNGLICLFTFN